MTYVYITCTGDKKTLCIWLTSDVKKAMESLKKIPILFFDSGEFIRRVIYAESHENYDLMKARFEEINRMTKAEKWAMINEINPELIDMSVDMAMA